MVVAVRIEAAGGREEYIAAHRFGFGWTRELLDTIDAASPVDVAVLAAPRFPSRY